MPSHYYIGLMSGTSADGIDAALVCFEDQPPRAHLVATHFEPYSPDLRTDLFSIFKPDSSQNSDQIDRLGHLDTLLGELMAQACLTLLGNAKLTANQVMAIGSHGQTVRHRPDGPHPFTLQIGNPHIIASQTRIQVVADFRRRDMILGGQAAPLAPAFHQHFLADRSEDRAILNIGGIANITYLDKEQQHLVAFDTGPGNGLLDAWILESKGESFDKNGDWAASGQPEPHWVSHWLQDPYFLKAPPKSTGKEYFHLEWSQSDHPDLPQLSPADRQASLAKLTLRSVELAVKSHCGNLDRMLVCGGGVHNAYLMTGLANALSCPVESTQQVGIDPDWVEAMAFAWFAKNHLEGNPLKLEPFTGSNQPVLLGSLFPSG